MALILQYPLGCPRSQIVEDVAHGFERPQVLVGNRNAELVLKRHVQLYRIQAVRLQVVGQAGIHGDLINPVL